jgi:hypothetical protein
MGRFKFREKPLPALGTATTRAVSVTALVRLELAAENARKASLEQRGLAVITSSGTLLTLIFAIGAAGGGTPLRVVGEVERVPLAIALFAFVAAAVLGIFINWTWYTRAFPVTGHWGLRTLVGPNLFDESSSLQLDRRLAEAHVEQLQTLRQSNNRKALFLQVALSLEVLAILGIAVVVGMRVF